MTNDPQEMRGILSMNAFDPRTGARGGPELDAQLRRRERVFGAASVLFYARPLEFVRGEGCRLFDAAGTAYLDAYNNVPSVGHCHPRVVEAAASQLATLNVHSRYVHTGILDYAERLLTTFPDPLSNITFTCTGSESNDLALRLAAEATGARGIIVTAAAYHGNTKLVTEASPSLMRHASGNGHVRVIPAPRTHRGGPPDRVSERFAYDVTAAIDDLNRHGHGFSALIVDGIFSSDGVFADPAGFLSAAIQAVHRARGLYIADEVQCGFGRTGDARWGFERHGVIPDLVTLGKPMGNGYPMAAVVSRPQLLDSFCSQYGYFNTFGGSPVAAAVGMAVLDVLEQEGLQENARIVGKYLQSSLRAMADRWPVLEDVRGAGLYIGVQIASERPDRSPATLAATLVNGLRERRVLIGTAGIHADVLKIRPPLCFSHADADQLVAALGDVLAGSGGP